jgi:hypothetical protein
VSECECENLDKDIFDGFTTKIRIGEKDIFDGFTKKIRIGEKDIFGCFTKIRIGEVRFASYLKKNVGQKVMGSTVPQKERRIPTRDLVSSSRLNCRRQPTE